MTATSLHPDWTLLERGWLTSLEADGYSAKSITTYRAAVGSLTRWLAAEGLTISPAELDRNHVRGWLAAVRKDHDSSARTFFAGVRSFARWLVAEGEATTDATAGVKYPRAGEPVTPVLSEGALRDLLALCAGQGFTSRRDTALLLCLADGGLRLAELAGLQVADVSVEDRMLYVLGKGTGRRGPRHRAVPVGVKTARALDRYLRERRHHPYAERAALWLGANGQQTFGAAGIDALIERLGTRAGIAGLHAHVFRHTWASQFRAAGGSEGDLMVLGGWRNRAMLDRYGAAAATDRAAESYRRLSLGDRL
jgi:site-specific recombinase XerD